jgi:hydroxyacylglutathione hydrolase
VPGSLNVPLNKSFPLWAGSLLPYEHEIVIAAPTETVANEAARALALIGIERVVGWVDATALLDAWREAGHEPQRASMLRSSELASHLDAQDVTVLDVRRQSEWEAGHLPGAMHIPLAELAERMDELPRDRPVAVHCQGGGRSAIASSYLRAQGLGEVMDASGGYSDWAGQGRPVVRERESVNGAIESSEPEEASR